MTSMTASAAESCCPGCDETDGVKQTSSTPSVAAWTCAQCGMNWAVTLVNHGQRPAAYFDRLAATVEEISRLRWLLQQVITLADDAPGLTDEQLRDRLAVLADRAHPIFPGLGHFSAARAPVGRMLDRGLLSHLE